MLAQPPSVSSKAQKTIMDGLEICLIIILLSPISTFSAQERIRVPIQIIGQGSHRASRRRQLFQYVRELKAKP